jgi:hypothetical protein
LEVRWDKESAQDRKMSNTLKCPEIKKWTEKLAYTGWAKSHPTPIGHATKINLILHSTMAAIST